METIRPGILVSLKTTLQGGVQYQRNDLDKNRDGASVTTKWETTRTIEDVAEYDRATDVRSKAAYLIRKVCIKSIFGLICPNDSEPALKDAVARAMGMARDHNTNAARTRINLYVIQGRIAADDAEAARALASEIRDLMDRMKAGIVGGNPEEIRKAASEAKALGGMLDGEYTLKLNAAVTQARQAARQIVKRIEEAGETAAATFGDLSTGAIDGARFAFLDLDGNAEHAAPDILMPAVNVQRVADLFAEIDQPAPSPEKVTV